jgi:hypothetical protein
VRATYCFPVCAPTLEVEQGSALPSRGFRRTAGVERVGSGEAGRRRSRWRVASGKGWAAALHRWNGASGAGIGGGAAPREGRGGARREEGLGGGEEGCAVARECAERKKLCRLAGEGWAAQKGEVSSRVRPERSFSLLSTFSSNSNSWIILLEPAGHFYGVFGRSHFFRHTVETGLTTYTHPYETL